MRRKLYGLIGPHEGKELALMLSGEKPMAAFTNEPGYVHDTDAFEAHVKSGRIVQFRVPINNGCERLYFCIPGEEWRAKLSLFISYQGEWNLTGEDLHKLDGFLLGYDKDSIDEFIEHWRTYEPKSI